MKKKLFITTLILIVLLSCQTLFAQQPVNWTRDQLLQPADLAKTLKSGENLPVIFSIGPGAVIPHSIDIGMVKDEKNLAHLRAALEKLPKSADIVVYCGCCPYEHCPNTRPAIALLKEMKFARFHLLDLPTNIRTDWIAKGYPVNPSSN